jgi:hypothetical protein
MRAASQLHRFRRHAVAAALAAMTLLAACGGDSGSNPVASVVGTYALNSVDSGSLPVTVYSDASSTVELLDEALTLRSDGKYATLAHVRMTENGQVTTDTAEDSGTYTLSGSTLAFVSTDPEVGSATGSVDGSTLTVRSGTTVLVFQR